MNLTVSPDLLPRIFSPQQSSYSSNAKPTEPCDGSFISIPLVGGVLHGIYHVWCGQCTKTAPNGSNRIRTDGCRSQIPVPYHLAILLIPYCYYIPKKNENHGNKSNQYCFILFVQCAKIKHTSQ